ncbi:MAG: hypothetical protein ACT4PV_02535 [Planctomycetaceae bacterium]
MSGMPVLKRENYCWYDQLGIDRVDDVSKGIEKTGTLTAGRDQLQQLWHE